MKLQQIVTQFLITENISPNRGIVVAVSTGVDSMVLLHALQKTNTKIIVAHVNHGVRKESKSEESFLVDFCKKQNLRLHILHLEKCPAKENFQAWARQKRYAFFNQVAAKTDCRYLATAHHADDKTETFFINALRGSGLTGLTSLTKKTNNIIRPLLSVSKNEIIAYAEAEKIIWFDDASNASDNYLRNRIRNHLLPELPNIYPNWEKGLAKTWQNISAEKNLIEELLETWRHKNVKLLGDEIHINLAALKTKSAETLLFHLLQKTDSHLPFAAMANAKTDAIGSFYLGKSHRALRDREALIISAHAANNKSQIEINISDENIAQPIRLVFSCQDISHDFSLTDLDLTKNHAALDFDKLTFPLQVRPWQPGDKFVPLGMKGNKKISDYLIDKKITRTHKENTFVLISAGKIVWLIGHQISDHFKVGQQTQKMYLGQLHN